MSIGFISYHSRRQCPFCSITARDLLFQPRRSVAARRPGLEGGVQKTAGLGAAVAVEAAKAKRRNPMDSRAGNAMRASGQRRKRRRLKEDLCDFLERLGHLV